MQEQLIKTKVIHVSVLKKPQPNNLVNGIQGITKQMLSRNHIDRFHIKSKSVKINSGTQN